MGTFYIKKGRDIKLKGPADKKIVDLPLPTRVAVQPQDFRGLKPRLVVKADEHVKVGSPLITDKDRPEIQIVSPVSGKVSAINRGEKRVLLQVVIEADGRQEAVGFNKNTSEQINGLSREDIIKGMLYMGLWPGVRQRPFSKMANPHDHPKAVFVHAMNTEPLALDNDFILLGKEKIFQTGLNIIKKLTKGEVHVCIKETSASKALTETKNVQIHKFSGPHPTGNVSTHIHCIELIHKGEIVWYIEAQDVLRIANTFLNGTYSPEQYVAVTGEGAKNRVYYKTVLGVPLSAILQGAPLEGLPAGQAGMRVISGSVLAGTNAGANGFLSYYDSQVTVVPEGGRREFLGWILPGLDKFSFSQTFLSSLFPRREVSLDTDKNGSDRAIVFNNAYDRYVALDIMTYFLLRAVIGGDIEESEKLGILECDEEDFALCTFACPSKVDVGSIIRRGLETIEREG